MPKRIKIIAGNVIAEGNLNDSKTAEIILKSLPLEGKVNTWGDEIYFSVPIKIKPENPKEIVELGDIGYWPPGSALCIFFGPTPASQGEEIRPASPVNVLGKIIGDPTIFKKVPSGAKIIIELS